MPRPTTAPRVDDEGVLTPQELTGPVVVRFEDEYVWSYHPHRDGTATSAGLLVAWPEVLVPRLVGSTRTRLTNATGDEVWFDKDVVFGGDPAPLELRDSKGRPLAVDKMGKLTRMFAVAAPEVIAALLDGSTQALADLSDLGVAGHLNYGALLGAVRDGHLIGHDNDADLAYLSRHTDPVDVITESYRMERHLRARGWKLVRLSAADLKLYHPLGDGTEAHVDVFGAFYVGDTFYLLGDTSGALPRDVIEPLGSVVLEGVEVAAPAQPERMLSFLYGESWRVPDPSFSREWPAEGMRRLDGWLRGQRVHIREWNSLLHANALPTKRSDFAVWVQGLLPPGDGVADIGCGHGRDSQYFARRRPVAAYDFTGTGLRKTRIKLARIAEDDAPEPDVYPLQLNEFRSVAVTGAELARKPQVFHVYSRYLLNCLDDDGRANLWRLASMASRRGGTISLEFLADSADSPVLNPGAIPIDPEGGAPMMRRLDADQVAAELRDAGFDVVELSIGEGNDVFDQTDPAVARLHARWPRPQHSHQEAP